MIILYDLETDGFYEECTKVHCGVCYDVTNAEYYSFTSKPMTKSDGSIEDMLKLLDKADIIIAHNGVNFDQPVLKKLYNWEHKGNVLDTLLISRLMYPNIMLQDANRKTIPPRLKGSHSLAAWGYRLRLLKGDYGNQEDAWDCLTPAMLEYCVRDVEVMAKMWKHFEAKGLPPQQAQWIEHEFAKIISRQEKYGVYFDVEAAQKLHVELLEEVDEVENKLYQVFTPLKTWTPKPYPKVAYKKNGQKSQVLLNQELLGCKWEGEQWGYYKEVHFNPSSRQHIARWLKEVYGWKPSEYTEKGSVIINEGVLNKLEFPEGKLLAHYFNVTKLVGQLAEGKNGWLKMVKKGNRIHGRVNTLGAVSRRCTHSNPNMAQVPSPRSYKGDAARRLFTVPKGKKIVGCDMSGLELRVFAHYLARYDGGKYSEVILKEDIHTYNQKAAGLPTRDTAKTFIYGTLYGAGDEKIGEIVGKNAKEGKRLRNMFKKNVPAYANLLEQVDRVYKDTKTLKALDGNPYHIRSAHSALNTLLQGAGALLCKVWLILTDQELQKAGYVAGVNYEFVLNVHDEFSNECDAAIAEDVARITQECTVKAGEYFNLRIRLDGEAKIGDTWYDVH